MGTTAEKLAYLKETKNQIKQALETPSNVMRDYANWIKKYVDNQPTSKVSDGVCTNALDVPLVSMGVDGNSEQKSYDGYQLLPNIENQTKNGISISQTNKGINVNGTSTEVYSSFTIASLELEAGTYMLKGIAGGSGSSYQIQIKINNTSFAYVTYLDKEFTLDTKSTITLILYVYSSYGTFNNLILPYMLVKGTTMPDTYEPYVGGQPSPNPDYPQDIEVIDGVNLFDITQLLNASGWVRDSNGYYTGIIDSYYTEFRNGFNFNKSFKINTSYTINVKSYSAGGTPRIVIKYTDTTFDKMNIYASTPTDFTFSTPNNKTISKIVSDFGTGSSQTLYIKDLMIYEGTIPKPNLPHGCIGLEQSGKNKFNKKLNIWSKTDKVSYFSMFVGTGTYTMSSPDMPVFSNGKNLFFLAGKVTSGANSNINGVDKNNPITVTTTDGYVTIANRYYYSTNIGIYHPEDYNWQIENGPIASSFEPYHETKVYPINLNGNSIAKVGDVKDLLKVYRNGDVEIEKKINKKIISLLGILTANDITISPFNINDKAPNNRTLNTAKCQKAIMTNGENLLNETFYENTVNFVFVGTQRDTLEDMKQKYDGAELYYQLATPQTIKLPSISPIELWQGTNNFKLITNLDTTFEMEYVVNKDYIMNTLET